MLQFYYNEQNRQTIGAFGTYLKELRRKYNITQIQLATTAVTTYQRISDYERFIRLPNVKTIQKILNALRLMGCEENEIARLETAYETSKRYTSNKQFAQLLRVQ